MEWRERQVTSGRGLEDSAGVVLSISHVNEDHAVLKRILDPEDWQVQGADCCEEAFRRLSSCPVSAIITNDALPDGDWMRILRHAQAQSRPPNLIVASRLADERLWAEVLNLGGYDVLIKPFVADEVRRVVSLACPLPHRRGIRLGQPAEANYATSAA
jgi:DNA-binding response OmpR family regulator